MTTKQFPLGYGVVVDFHAPRQDGGVPTFWDGWYSDKALALKALAIARQKHPGAFVHLVQQFGDDGAVVTPDETSYVTGFGGYGKTGRSTAWRGRKSVPTGVPTDGVHTPRAPTL